MLRHITGPLSRALLRTVSIGDAWQRFEYDVPIARYGIGARHDFSWYLEGESDVRLSTLEDVVAWLTGCQYRRDTEFFHETDYWQHPCTFEKLRVGDCEDFALWAWRRLGELGFDVEFVAGRTRASDDGNSCDPWSTGHAWVHFLDAGRPMLLDAVACRTEPIVRPIESVRGGYVPEVSVDGTLRRYVYGGYYLLRSGRALP